MKVPQQVLGEQFPVSLPSWLRQAGEATVETNSFQLFQLEGEELCCKGVVPALWQRFGFSKLLEERDSF